MYFSKIWHLLKIFEKIYAVKAMMENKVIHTCSLNVVRLQKLGNETNYFNFRILKALFSLI